jgi:hypothetical protein
MANSARFSSLAQRVTQLEQHLLPVANINGNYTDQEQDFIRSYCLLAHAEIESFIEDIILEVTTRAMTKWNINKEIITPIIFHLTFNCKTRDDPYSMTNQSFVALQRAIKSNNGIKEQNLINLLNPIGIGMDRTLVNTLTTFGETRGQIAHSSFRTHNILDPSNEKQIVNTILTGIKIFDDELDDYERNGSINPINNILSYRRPIPKLMARIKKWVAG